MWTDRPRERTRLATRLIRRALALPDGVLDKVIGAPPVVLDGRVLDRRVQTMMAIGDRIGLTEDVCDVAARRDQLRRSAGIGMPARLGIHVVDRRLPGPAGEIPVRVYRKLGGAAEPAAIVYLHGGGWVVGDLDSHDGSCRLLADTSGCVVVSVDYRLAPEHPFPAAVEDSVAAYRWVQEHPEELGTAPGRVGVMGDSAGGNLAAVVARVARDGDVPAPVAQCLVYPATDAHFRSRSHELFADGSVRTREAMGWYGGHYLPDVADWDSPLASPLLEDDLDGVAPAVVVTAGFDPLRDEGRAYADKLAAAGVSVRYRCYDDLVHGFFGMGVLPEGLAIATEICGAMGELMADGQPSSRTSA
jgi:acetyl esterase